MYYSHRKVLFLQTFHCMSLPKVCSYLSTNPIWVVFRSIWKQSSLFKISSIYQQNRKVKAGHLKCSEWILHQNSFDKFCRNFLWQFISSYLVNTFVKTRYFRNKNRWMPNLRYDPNTSELFYFIRVCIRICALGV